MIIHLLTIEHYLTKCGQFYLHNKKLQKESSLNMNQTKSIAAPHSKTYEITMTALMAAVTCILAPLSIPIGPVPISFTNLAIYLSLYLLGWKRGTISYLIYLLLGLVGLPVFSGFTGGPAKLAGRYWRIHHRIYRYGHHCRTGN